MAKTTKKISASDFGALGGNATFKKHGSEHYKKMIAIRWDKYRKEKRRLAKLAKESNAK